MQTTHMATPVLEVAHLEKVYGALGNVTRALNDVSFTVNRGEFVGIMGASGSGKSTLLKIMAGIEEVSNGDARLTPGYTVGILQQEPPLDDDKTVIENVRMAFGDMIAKVDRFNKIGEEMCDPDCDMDALMAEMGKLQDEIDAADGWDIDSKLGQAMDALQLPDSDMPVNVLSGGERRRVALCKLLLGLGLGLGAVACARVLLRGGAGDILGGDTARGQRGSGAVGRGNEALVLHIFKKLLVGHGLVGHGIPLSRRTRASAAGRNGCKS